MVDNLGLGATGEFPVSGRTFTPPQPGEHVTFEGRNYWLGRLVGQGYFGAVYECTDDWSNPLVAKVLLPQDRSYDTVRDEWLRELNNLVLLRHPNVTFIHDAFEYRDTFYLVVERCDNTLTELIEWSDLDPNVWVYPIAQSILQAIHFIHRSGFVHKDIHPGNVHVSFTRGFMATPSPVTVFKLGDFGITRLESEINVFNTMLAKWMLPPEALRPAEFGVIDKRVDIYHVGLCLLSLLLKDVPSFTEEEIVGGKPRQLAERLVHPIAAPLAAALRRHVADRTVTALEMWRQISVARAGGSGTL